jgi:hypothetical protein
MHDIRVSGSPSAASSGASSEQFAQQFETISANVARVFRGHPAVVERVRAVVGESVSLDRGVAARTIFLDSGPSPLPPPEPDPFPPCRIQGSSSPAETRTVDFVTQPPSTPTDDPYVEVSAIVVFTDQQAPACGPVTTTTKVSNWGVGAP